MPEDQALYNEAIKHIKDPDVILNMFDKSVCWISDAGVEMLAKPKAEIIGTPVYSFFTKVSLLEAAKMGAKDLLKKKGVSEYPSKTKDGPMYLKFQFEVFDFEGSSYYVGKLIGTRPIEGK